VCAISYCHSEQDALQQFPKWTWWQTLQWVSEASTSILQTWWFSYSYMYSKKVTKLVPTLDARYMWYVCILLNSMFKWLVGNTQVLWLQFCNIERMCAGKGLPALHPCTMHMLPFSYSTFTTWWVYSDKECLFHTIFVWDLAAVQSTTSWVV